MKTAFDLIIQFVIRAIIAANSYQIFSNTQKIKICIPAHELGARRYNYSFIFIGFRHPLPADMML